MRDKGSRRLGPGRPPRRQHTTRVRRQVDAEGVLVDRCTAALRDLEVSYGTCALELAIDALHHSADYAARRHGARPEELARILAMLAESEPDIVERVLPEIEIADPLPPPRATYRRRLAAS